MLSMRHELIRIVATWLVFLACAGLPVPAESKFERVSAATGVVHALVVGIDRYQTLPDLQGCVNDAQDIAAALRALDILATVLIDGAATRNAVMGHLDRLIARAAPGDTVLFTFSGHGAQEPGGNSATEADGVNEGLLLANYSMTGAGAHEMIMDDEIGAWIDRAGTRGLRVITVFDVDHAGTLHDRFPPPDHLFYFGAAADHESVPEVMVDGRPHGALSVGFSEALRRGDTDRDGWLTHREIARQVLDTVSRKVERRQTPVTLAASSRMDEPLVRIASVAPVSPAASNRFALVIGNGAYASLSPLRNPGNDAQDVAESLRGLGFVLAGGRALVDLTREQMLAAVGELADRTRRGDTALFFFAGHGAQFEGESYLVPVNDRGITYIEDLPDHAVSVAGILDKLDARDGGTNLIFLDSCRNAPLPSRRANRDATRGMARVDAPASTFIAYAAAPGQVAADGTGRNGVFTAALLSALRQPGVLSVNDLMDTVTGTVRRASQGAQVPWRASSLEAPFYFRSSTTGTMAAPLPAVAIPKPTTLPPTPQGDGAYPARYRGITAASYPCQGNLSQLEYLICSEPRLARADGVLNALYQDLQSALDPDAKDALRREQRAWLRNRNSACTAGTRAEQHACVLDAMDRRIAEMLRISPTAAR